MGKDDSPSEYGDANGDTKIEWNRLQTWGRTGYPKTAMEELMVAKTSSMDWLKGTSAGNRVVFLYPPSYFTGFPENVPIIQFRELGASWVGNMGVASLNRCTPIARWFIMENHENPMNK